MSTIFHGGIKQASPLHNFRNMDAAIIDQPDSELLSSFEDRVCEEVIELDMFRNADRVIIQEKSQRLGGTLFTLIFLLDV